MKLLLTYFVATLIFLISPVKADELKNKVTDVASKKVSEYVLGWIPGEGHTEFSFDVREDNKPQFSILAVRELSKTDTGNIFNQFSARSTDGYNSSSHGNDTDRIILNYGVGKRTLYDEKNLLLGFNNFYDYDLHTGNARTSFGFEAKGPVTDISMNRYLPLNNSGSEEFVLAGWDYKIASQVPYYHWAKVFINGYIWEGKDRTNVEGTKFGGEARIDQSINLEVSYDNKNISGLNDEWTVSLEYVYPPREGPTALDGKSDDKWNLKKDMSDELLGKVERTNNIVIEFKGNAVITRAD